MGQRPTAQCALCQQVRLLRASHLIAAGFSRHLRNSNAEGKNPNPFKIAWGQKVQTSSQFKEYLLCDECDQSLARNGENWVVEHCAHSDGTFPLRTLLEKTQPIETNPTYLSYSPDREIDINRISHFAAGVFWRAAVCRFSDGKDRTELLGLGKRYTEEFRQFLRGQSSFPAKSALWVRFSRLSPVLLTTCLPMTAEEGRSPFHYFFQVPGIGFDLFVGGEVKELQGCCMVHDPLHPIIGATDLDKDAATAQYYGALKLAPPVRRTRNS
jgi:hypothetical protein